MPDPATVPSSSPGGTSPRLSFFDEQAKRRAQAKAWGWATMGVAWLLGWVLGFLVLSAVLFYALLLTSFLPRPVEAAFKKLVPDGDAALPVPVVGGLFFALALWGAVRLLLGHDSSAAFLGRLQARAPNPADPEEKQLVNLVEEMAIAATAPVPSVMLLDGEAINAAALGPDPRNVTVLVLRRMLDALDRDETQGVIGHLMASAINGDLSLTAEMLRVFYVLGLAVTILDLPFSSRARGAFADLLRFVLRSQGSSVIQESKTVTARLTESLQPEGLTPLLEFMQRLVEPKGDNTAKKIVGSLILMPLLPLIMIRIGAAILYGLLSLFVLGPLVALLLRSRRRLADATAVQLTRNPDGLACALVHLSQEAHVVANAGWSEMLFIVGPEASGARRAGQFQQKMDAIPATGNDWKIRAQAGLAAAKDHAAAGETGSEATRHNFILGFHPSLTSRIAQLTRMGATKVQWDPRPDYSGWLLAAVVTVVVGAVVALAIAGSRH